MSKFVPKIILVYIIIYVQTFNLNAQFDALIPDSIYISAMSNIDEIKLYKTVLMSENPFLCMHIVTEEYNGEAVVSFIDLKKWFECSKRTDSVSFSEFTLAILTGDTLKMCRHDLTFHKVDSIIPLKDIKQSLDTCLRQCNAGVFDYNLIASLFHHHILIERLNELADDAHPYWRFSFYYYNGTENSFKQTNKLLNESLILFLDSIDVKDGFYLTMNDDFEPSNSFQSRYGEHVIRYFPCWTTSHVKKKPNNASVVLMDYFRVYEGDCIVSYIFFKAKKVTIKGKRHYIAQVIQQKSYRYSYDKKQLDWVLITPRLVGPEALFIDCQKDYN